MPGGDLQKEMDLLRGLAVSQYGKKCAAAGVSRSDATWKEHLEARARVWVRFRVRERDLEGSSGEEGRVDVDSGARDQGRGSRVISRGGPGISTVTVTH